MNERNKNPKIENEEYPTDGNKRRIVRNPEKIVTKKSSAENCFPTKKKKKPFSPRRKGETPFLGGSVLKGDNCACRHSTLSFTVERKNLLSTESTRCAVRFKNGMKHVGEE
jgi:hypothetical protein